MLIYLIGLLGFFILVGWLMYLVAKIDEGLISKYQPPRIPPTWESGPYHCSRCRDHIYASRQSSFCTPPPVYRETEGVNPPPTMARPSPPPTPPPPPPSLHPRCMTNNGNNQKPPYRSPTRPHIPQPKDIT